MRNEKNQTPFLANLGDGWNCFPQKMEELPEEERSSGGARGEAWRCAPRVVKNTPWEGRGSPGVQNPSPFYAPVG